jgi:hypothetical protein
MALNNVSSAQTFTTLIKLGKSRGSTDGVKVNAAEVKAALNSFSWTDGKTTKSELKAAVEEFASLQRENQLTADGARAFQDWLEATPNTPGRFTSERSGNAFANLESFLRYNPSSQGGATLTQEEAGALVSVLGKKPPAARVAQVIELHRQLRVSKQSPEARKVLRDWLNKNPMARPSDSLMRALVKPLRGLTWPSETDRAVYPVYPVDIGAAPASDADAVKAARKALGETAMTPIEVRDFDETFAQLTRADDPGSKARAQKFTAIYNTMKSSLTDLRVIRVGTRDIDVYAVGKDANGRWVGVMSRVE